VEPEDAPEVLEADIIHARGRSPRANIAEWASIRAMEPTATNVDIAARIGISPKALNAQINKASRDGWLQFEDPLSRIEHEIVPKVLDNLNHFLDLQDRTVTVEAAKGTIFRTYQEAKGVSDAPRTVLALKIEHSGRDENDIKVIAGTVVGRPRQIQDDDET
jgi:hypothetical protein